MILNKFLKKYSSFRDLLVNVNLNFVYAIILIPLFLLSNIHFPLKSNGNELKKVKLQLKWKHQFQFAGFYAAIEKGYYKDVGLDVTLVEAKENEEPSDAVFNKSAHFGVSTSDIVLSRYKGKPAVILAPIFQHSPQVIIASKNAQINHIHDLIDKRVMIESNAADIISYLKDEGISIEKLKVLPHSFDVNALINNEVDALSAYKTDEPFILQQLNFDYTIINPLSGGIDFYGDILFTSEDMINNSPNTVKNFLKASLKGWNYAMDNSEEIVQIIYNKYSQRHSIEHLRFEANEMQKYVKSDVVEIGYVNPGRLEQIIQIYQKLGLVGSGFKSEGLLYSHYIKPEVNIPWTLIIGSISLILIFVILTFYYIFLNKKLKIEIKNKLAIQNELEIANKEIRLEIENRKKTEDSLRKLSVAVEQSPVSIVITDLTGAIEYANPNFATLTGYTFEEVKGKNPRILKTDKTNKKIYPELWNDLKQGKRWRGEFVNRKKNGEEFIENATIAPIFDSEGKITNFIAIKEDITEYYQAMQALNESEAKFRQMADLLPQIIFEADLQGILTYVNKHGYNLCGYSLDENLIGRSTLSFFIEEDRMRAGANIKQSIIEQKNSVSNEYNLLKKDGSTFPVLIYSAPIKKDGYPIGIRGIIVDISEIKKTELELLKLNKDLNDSKEQLEILNSTKDKFFSIIAHDLRNPLHAIKFNIDFLNRDYSRMNQDYLAELLKNTANATNHLHELLENLLLWSSSQSKKINYNPKFVNIHNIVSEIVNLYQQNLSKKKISPKIEINKDFEVFGDENMLKTILRNLFSNSVKFTPNNGSITFKNNDSLDETIISVIDTGVGMDENQINDLLKNNTSKTSLGTSNEKGTGLGILLCLEFVDYHQGRIEIVSQKGVGSEFKIIIPKKS